MLEDCYQLALDKLRGHLDAVGHTYADDDGDLIVSGHRIGLSIAFEGFSRQQNQALAPLDICVHLDGDEGDRFRVGTIGVGATQSQALAAAVEEWHLLAAAPLLAALGAAAPSRRRTAETSQLAGWDLFPGRAGVRGPVPAGLQPGGPFWNQLLLALRSEVSNWSAADDFALRSIFVMGSGGAEASAQAAVDGFVNEPLSDAISQLPWPATGEPYFYKQLFVLRCRPTT
ncbi:MAG: hypothetical protein DWQ35_17710 [Planctomycetota bacterium]|nr:MAG: hypothetical protein DWQ35_17710 [Planctomycetota bacterium]REK25195.1 MAG: hypothetical protein DWQ42_11910 [Planctomycetota bacterium]REK43225.1 MAG: hypothetical protein DWQ46_12700 [Planctomycetota bacterium]